MATNQYKALLLDLDDTIINFKKSEETGLAVIYKKHMPDTLSFQAFESHYHLINNMMWHKVDTGELLPAQVGALRFEELFKSLKMTGDAELASWDYEHAISEEVHWFAGAENTIMQLKKNYKIGIITNGLSMAQNRKKALMKMDEWADCCIISEDVGCSKPDPAIFNLALKALGVNHKDCLMVGDNLKSDYLGAQRSNIDFCWVKQPHTLVPENIQPPQVCLSSIAELPGFLTLQSKVVV